MSVNQENISNSAEGLCRCCLTEGKHQSWHTPYVCLENGGVQDVTYYKLLREYLNIEMIENRKSSEMCSICFKCIHQLDNAVKFKRQVQKCEKEFREIYFTLMEKDPDGEAIKEEIDGLDEPEIYVKQETEICEDGKGIKMSDDDCIIKEEEEIQIIDDSSCDGDVPVNSMVGKQNGVQKPDTTTNDNIFNATDDIDDDDDGLSDHNEKFFKNMKTIPTGKFKKRIRRKRLMKLKKDKIGNDSENHDSDEDDNNQAAGDDNEYQPAKYIKKTAESKLKRKTEGNTGESSDSEDVPLTKIKKEKDENTGNKESLNPPRKRGGSRKGQKKEKVTEDDEYRPSTDEDDDETEPRKRGRQPKKNKQRRRAQGVLGSEDEEDIGTIDGISVIKVNIGTMVQRGIHYKKLEGSFQCLECSFTCNSLFVVRNHYRSIHFNKNVYRCTVCYDHFETLPKLVEHNLHVHNIDQRFKCKACDKNFLSKLGLDKHARAFHKLGTVYKCSKCNFETFHKSSFVHHFKVHSDVKKYKCQYCKKAFKRLYGRALHERIHTGDKRHVCKVCGFAYVDGTSLKYHMRRLHPDGRF